MSVLSQMIRDREALKRASLWGWEKTPAASHQNLGGGWVVVEQSDSASPIRPSVSVSLSFPTCLRRGPPSSAARSGRRTAARSWRPAGTFPPAPLARRRCCRDVRTWRRSPCRPRGSPQPLGNGSASGCAAVHRVPSRRCSLADNKETLVTDHSKTS